LTKHLGRKQWEQVVLGWVFNSACNDKAFMSILRGCHQSSCNWNKLTVNWTFNPACIDEAFMMYVMRTSHSWAGIQLGVR